MANIIPALEKVYQAEFGNNPDKYLHKNAGEDGYTLGGIYQSANPFALEWTKIEKMIDMFGLERASRMLYFDLKTSEDVINIYRKKYWNSMNLDHVYSQKIAEEMFLMGVVSGVKNAIKLAQKVVGVNEDGILGQKSLSAINNFNEDEFDRLYDKVEVAYFEDLVKKKPFLSRFLKGWVNRSEIA